MADVEWLAGELAAWAHPALDFESRVTRDWPFVRVSHMLAFLAAYLVLVAYGVRKRANAPKVRSSAV
jgi:hypothetical protein